MNQSKQYKLKEIKYNTQGWFVNIKEGNKLLAE